MLMRRRAGDTAIDAAVAAIFFGRLIRILLRSWLFIAPAAGRVIRFVALRATTEMTYNSAAILHQQVHVGRLRLNCDADFDRNPKSQSRMGAPDGLPDLTYPFHDRAILVTACGRMCLYASRSTSRAGWQAKGSESKKSTRACGSSASCITISDTPGAENLADPTTRPARGCHLCLRYDLSPISPG
jgi:hypothetical protein